LALRIVNIRGHKLRFYLDSARVNASSGLEARMARIEACLALLPPEHINMIVEPIIVVDTLPGGRTHSGGWYAPAGARGLNDSDTVRGWLGPGNVDNTGIDAAEVTSRTGGSGGTGIIAITSAAFLRDDDWGHDHMAHEYTVLHEVGHSVDFHSGLIPPPRLAGRYGNAPYQGQRYEGGNVHELAAEAYSRFFLRPTAMCRGGNGTPPCVQPDGTSAPLGAVCPSQRRCSGRHQRDLMNTAAFHLTSVVFPLARLELYDPHEAGRSGPGSSMARRHGPQGETGQRIARRGVAPYGGWRVPGPDGIEA